MASSPGLDFLTDREREMDGGPVPEEKSATVRAPDRVNAQLYSFFDTRAGAAGLDVGTCTWVNMKDSKRRRNVMKRNFERVGRAHTRFEATTPATLPLIQLFSGDQKMTSKDLTPENQRVMSCSFSHLSSICAAHPTTPDGGFAVIMEDDVVVDRNVNFAAIVATAPKDWEILQLACINPARTAQMFNVDFMQKKQLWSPWNRVNMGAAVYIVRKTWMTRLLPLRPLNFKTLFTRKELLAFDWLLYRTGKTYTMTIPLFNVEGIDSELHTDHVPLHQKTKGVVNQIFKHGAYIATTGVTR